MIFNTLLKIIVIKKPQYFQIAMQKDFYFAKCQALSL